MAFYYAKEKYKFDQEWEKLRGEYEAAGMCQKDIELLYSFDWEWFCSRRRFMEHTQNLPAETIESENREGRSSLIRKFSSFSIDLDEAMIGGRYGWVEEIEDVSLAVRLQKLSSEDLELLTLIAMEGYSQTELGKKFNCNQSVLSRKIKRIKEFLR